MAKNEDASVEDNVTTENPADPVAAVTAPSVPPALEQAPLGVGGEYILHGDGRRERVVASA